MEPSLFPFLKSKSMATTPFQVSYAEDAAWLESFIQMAYEQAERGMCCVPSLAQSMAVSESTLLRKVKKLTGLSPVQYLQNLKLKKAKRLLESASSGSVAQVARRVGYQDASTFARTFRRRYGVCPSDLR